MRSEAFHERNRSAPHSQDRETYADLFPGVPDGLPQVWPASDREPRQIPTTGEPHWQQERGGRPC
ncbi:hypothetical protein [Streptomyces sp. AC550_RSS872]|uniref:hypothetical protein n=1 Tax=Streptomyces sp. AC550_RSS872 TaxID=2823689 RepID=UPI001C25D0DA